MSDDPYEGMGEFHDLFMPEVWGALRPALVAAFGALRADAVLVDLGAGTGVGTRTLAQVTAAQVIAVEPSLTMRAVLLARVADDPELVERVSVLAGRVPEVLAEVETPIAGFVCAHMLGHLAAAERQSTFTRLADLLAPDGIGVITLPRSSGSESGEVVEETTRIGRHRYVARHRSLLDGRTSVSEYLVLAGDRVIREKAYTSIWDPPTLDQLQDELGRAGLHLGDSDGRVGLVRPAGAPGPRRTIRNL